MLIPMRASLQRARQHRATDLQCSPRGCRTRIVAGAIALLLSGCDGSLSSPQNRGRVQLAEVSRGDRYLEGDIVRVGGTVGDRVPLVDAQIYYLYDETGSIWVLTSDTGIQSGDRIIVEGEVAIEIIEMGPVTETQRYLRDIE